MSLFLLYFNLRNLSYLIWVHCVNFISQATLSGIGYQIYPHTTNSNRDGGRPSPLLFI